MSAAYGTIADMQAAGWTVEVQSGSNFTAMKVNTDNPGAPVHVYHTSSASLILAADAVRAHREGRGLHI